MKLMSYLSEKLWVFDEPEADQGCIVSFGPYGQVTQWLDPFDNWNNEEGN